jgi:aldose 1-epimerase
MMIAADRYVQVDATLIPTGDLPQVQGTPLDFRQPTPIGQRIEQLAEPTGGYDHCYVVRGEAGSLRLAARVVEPGSGRVMEVFTTQPGVQFYTGNFLAGTEASGGYGKHQGFCLETQHYPDSPNQAQFPSTVLKPGQTLHEVTVHRFSTQQ